MGVSKKEGVILAKLLHIAVNTILSASIYKQSFSVIFVCENLFNYHIYFISFFAKGQFLDTFKVFLHSKPSIDARLESRYSFLK
jgi:hypothetical protein